MNNRTYQTELTSLKDVLSKLDQKDIDLAAAMQLYNEGLQHKNTCMETLNILESQVKQSQNTVDTSNGSENLNTIFDDLTDIEHAMNALPDTDLEATVELLAQAEKLLQAGETHVQTLADEIKESQQTTGVRNV